MHLPRPPRIPADTPRLRLRLAVAWACAALLLAFATGCSALWNPGPYVVGGDDPEARVTADNAPSYQGEPYAVVNNNIPGFTAYDATTGSFERYSGLDQLQRCGEAFLCVGLDLLPLDERESIGSIKPSGWQTAKYDFIDGKYLFNRCHLAAYMLSGENTNKLNLITGTRYLNTVGMLPFEEQVYEYVLTTGNHVLYRVTPMYEGSNLVATGVQMEACSVEDMGTGVCFNVFVFNVQPGVEIDYSNGESQLSGNWEAELEAAGIEVAPVSEDSQKPQQASNGEPDDTKQDAAVPAGTDYVLNTNTLKFHLPSCDSVAGLSEKNRGYFTGSREEAIAAGYEPCGKCKP